MKVYTAQADSTVFQQSTILALFLLNLLLLMNTKSSRDHSVWCFAH